MKQKAMNKLGQMLLEGLASGYPIPVTREFWEIMRKDLIERHQNQIEAQAHPQSVVR